MDNMDRFNECVVLILDRLFKHFPIETDIKPADLFDDPTEWSKSFASTVRFLERENFIHFRNQTYGPNFSGVVLTSKGLAVLNAIPDSLETKETFGEKISHAATDMSKDVAKSVVSQLIMTALSLIIKS